MPVYTPATWVENAPPDLNAANLNDWETRIDQAFDQHEADLALHSSGRELAYAERTADYSWSGTAITDLPAVGTSGAALSITFTAGSRPVELVAEFPLAYLAAGTALTVYATDAANAVVAQGQFNASAGQVHRLIAKRRLSLTNGQSYTYKLRWVGAGATPSGIFYGGITYPISLQAIER